jgi:hypothetical protein
VPRFNLKKSTQIANIPINEPIKPTQEVIIKAIKYGMVFLINYKGAEDKHFAGHERVIYPMVLGRSSSGKFLLRGYHLNGWSVSSKEWLIEECKILIRESLLNTYPEVFEKKDFLPKQNLSQFKF